MIKRIKIGTSSCGRAAGALEVYNYFKANINGIPVIEVGCNGHCYAEPLCEVETESDSYFYHKGKPTQEFLKKVLNPSPETAFKIDPKRQKHEYLNVTKLAGRVDPISIAEYREHGGYQGLKKALKTAPLEVIQMVTDSQIRGRGGAGFATGIKWSFMASHKAEEKIIICNADEGDPGAFTNRLLMESLPHQVMEGMLIAAYAVGATQIFIYVRAEYPLAIEHIRIAIDQIRENKLNVLDGREVSIKIKEGAGAFVCGEETAMIHSLEGKRGTPRLRPPYPAEHGYKGYPTSVNNVETFANIPIIVRDGVERYLKIGTSKSKGTKLFSLAGDLKHPGVAEIPMGTTIREMIYDIGGADEGSVKAIQTGGPSGGCIPSRLFETPIDYDSLKSLGAIMGSGGLISIGSNRCIVETARYFLDFTTRESCGKCTFCRVGTKRMLEILERITKGEGALSDLETLEDLGNKIKQGSLCGLGQSAPNPVLATLKYFREEFIEHVKDKKCDALECNALVDIAWSEEKCTDCKLCIKTCPVKAITESYDIDNNTCTRCNSCIEVCPKDALYRTNRGGN